MGNIFEPAKANSKRDPQQEFSKAYLQLGEISSIKALYEDIRSAGFGHDQILNSFGGIKIIADIIYEKFKKDRSLKEDYFAFERLIIHLTRYSSDKTIQTVFDLVCNVVINERERLNLFFQCLYSFASPTSPEQSRVEAAERMLHLFDMNASKIDQNYAKSQSLPPSKYPAILCDFVNNYLPNSAKAIETFISKIAFPSSVASSVTFQPFSSPRLNMKSSIVEETDLIALALHNSQCQGSWRRLYSSQVDGMSFNRVAHHLLGYDGPTCLLVKCMGGNIIGAFANERWHDLNRFHGSSSNTLFALQPKLRLLRCKIPSNGCFQYLNSHSYGMPHGLGFGGSYSAQVNMPVGVGKGGGAGVGAAAVGDSAESFRFFIPESLEYCTAKTSCLTYESGKLLDSTIPEIDREENFEIDVLEIWGCGGSDELVERALQGQAKMRHDIDENIQKARKVDRAAFFNNEFDREMFLSNTFSHNKGARRDVEEMATVGDHKVEVSDVASPNTLGGNSNVLG